MTLPDANDPSHRESSTERSPSDVEYFCITCANEMRQELNLDEDSYQMLSRTYEHRNKRFLIYGVLDEIEKVGAGLLVLGEYIDSPASVVSGDSVRSRLQRNVVTSVHGILSMYERRLTELLVELICLCEVSREVHIKHYLLYKEFHQYDRYRSNQRVYYGIHNANAAFVGQKLVEWLQRVEEDERFEWPRCWYLQLKANSISKGPGKNKASTFEERYRKALKHAKANELLVLGLTYDDAFGEPSRDIHLNLGGVAKAATQSGLQDRRSSLAILSGFCLIRCQTLLHGRRRRRGLIAELARELYGNQAFRGTLDRVSGRGLRVGDFAIVRGDICEIIESSKSEFGYKAFKVRFLEENRVAQVDSFPASSLVKFGRRTDLTRNVVALLREMGAVPPGSRVLAKIVRQYTLELWTTAGAREEYFGEHAKAEEKRVAYVAELERRAGGLLG